MQKYKRKQKASAYSLDRRCHLPRSLHNLAKVFNFRTVRSFTSFTLFRNRKTAQLKVENSAQTTFRFSPVSFCTLRIISEHRLSFDNLMFEPTLWEYIYSLSLCKLDNISKLTILIARLSKMSKYISKKFYRIGSWWQSLSRK